MDKISGKAEKPEVVLSGREAKKEPVFVETQFPKKVLEEVRETNPAPEIKQAEPLQKQQENADGETVVRRQDKKGDVKKAEAQVLIKKGPVQPQALKAETKAAKQGRKAPEKTKAEEKEGLEPKKNEQIEKARRTQTQVREQPKKEEKVRLSLVTQVKSILSGDVELGEGDVSSALEDFEMELLEADVAYEVAEQIKDELRAKLVGKKVGKKELQSQIAGVFLSTIRDIMAENTGPGILERVAQAKARPIKIMFSGPNGSGKTTTIAKVAFMLKQNGYGVVIAAADTFRAAAIEQMEVHGARLGVKVVKGKYGADPTSVAFDAVNHAKAHGVDVVLIDTAGRQETNQNLLNELRKMVRVIAPDIKVYVGESVAGNAVIEQVSSFNKELGLDGVILTKLDCDGKGGTVISISKITKVPVLYVTTGEGYQDIEAFDPERMAKAIAA